jgi:hypothetical protein
VSPQIKQLALMGDVNAAAVNHPEERDGPAVLAEDHGAGGVELELRLGDHLSQLLGGERIERRPQREESSNLAQTCVRG